MRHGEDLVIQTVTDGLTVEAGPAHLKAVVKELGFTDAEHRTIPCAELGLLSCLSR